MSGDEIKQARDLFRRGLLPERDHPVPGFVEFAQNLAEQPMFQLRVLGNRVVYLMNSND